MWLKALLWLKGGRVVDGKEINLPSRQKQFFPSFADDLLAIGITNKV
jgi:hypothetical protein